MAESATTSIRFERSRALLLAVVSAWLVVGTIDIGVAAIYYPLTAPVTVIGLLQGIASGVLGVRAFAGGVATAALGLVCHYTIALIWTVLFFALYPRIRAVAERRWASAVLYGVAVSLVMNLVVVPLSNVPSRPFSLSQLVVATVILIFTIGVPLSLLAGLYYDGRARSS